MIGKNPLKFSAILVLSLLFILVGTNYSETARAASHREAPITAIDQKADITDWFAFVSYENGRQNTVTFLLNVDPFLEPSNGPNYFPFDPEIHYKMNIDNNQDAVDDIIFLFKFTTEIRLPGVFTGFVGAGTGINAPPNAPQPPIPNPVIPPAITALDGPNSVGLSLRQRYSVTIMDGEGSILFETDVDEGGDPLFAVPSNVGPRTMPAYSSLASQGIYTLSNEIRVFAGTVDDPFYIDLGAAFDSLNFRTVVLTPEQDADDNQNFGGCDDVSGFNVNTIAIEVPITMLTSDGQIHTADEPEAVIGSYGVTLRPRTKMYNGPGEPLDLSEDFVKIQRMGNALFNELIIGTGSKDLWSMSEPEDDAQFADFALDPLFARVLNAAFPVVTVPDAPRTDLLPLVQYIAPICPGCPDPGPIADLLRLNTGIPPTPPGLQSRLGFISTILDNDLLNVDPSGYPNGRRAFDDVTDISTRVAAGILAPGFNVSPNDLLGDGVNTNDVPYQVQFPYVAFANSGRDSVHQNPGDVACFSAPPPPSGGGSSSCSIAAPGSNTSMGSLMAILFPVLYVFGRRFVKGVRKSRLLNTRK